MATVTLRHPPTRPRLEVRGGPAYWLGGYRTMLCWQLASLRIWLPTLALVQVLAGAGMVLGIGLLFADIPPTAALYVSSGVPVINLVMVGLILGPQLIADQKTQQSYDFLQALPVPRTMTALAWYTVTLIGGIPAVVVSLLVAQSATGSPSRFPGPSWRRCSSPPSPGPCSAMRWGMACPTHGPPS